MKKYNVLHITGYMGDAGIGKAISGVVLNDKVNLHTILCLEKSMKRHEIESCITQGICVLENPDTNVIEEQLEQCDVAIIHWWHYPPMTKFLAEFPKISCRVILWSHVSGCNYPFLSVGFLQKFDYIFLTSPYAYDNPIWNVHEREAIKKNSRIVYGLSDIQVPKQKVDYELKEELFNILYVGTFTESKLYPKYATICKNIIGEIPNVKFVMLGDDTRAKWLKEELCRLEIDEYFRWVGFVDNVYSYLHDADLFLYPLNPFHFGTTENVILEAMAVGLPIVLFNQAAEKYIVRDEIDGILADNEEEIVSSVIKLYKDKKLRKQLGNNAKEAFVNYFSIEKNMFAFQEGIEACMGRNRTEKNFDDCIGSTAHEWFLSAMLPAHRELFEGLEKIKEEELERVKLPAIFREKTKSSVHHFLQYFEDEQLLKWSQLLRNDTKEELS